MGDQFDPSISGDYIVYTDLRGIDADLWYYDISSGLEFPVTTAPGNQQLSDVSAGRLIYTDYRTYDVIMYEIATGVTTVLTLDCTAPALDPAIGGNLVAWEDLRTGNRDMYAMDTVTGELRALMADPPDNIFTDQKPAVADGTIVWEKSRAGLSDIACYDWVTGTSRLLTPSASDERNPEVSGRYVVYDTLRGADRDICVYDLVTDTEYVYLKAGDQINPSVSGNNIAFEDSSEGLYHVWVGYIADDGTIGSAWDLSDYGVPTTSAQFLNDIDGNRVVFTDDREGQLDIYMFEFSIDPNEVVHAASLTADQASVVAQWGQTVSWTITVENTGTDTDTFYLNPSIVLDPIPWSEITLDQNPVTLDAGERITVTVTTTMPQDWKATSDVSGTLTIWVASTADMNAELDSIGLQLTVQPTPTSVLLTLEEMVKDVIADLNAQIVNPTPAGVADVMYELQTIIDTINQAEADGLLSMDDAQALRASAQAALNSVTKASLNLDSESLKKALNELNTTSNQSNAMLNKIEDMMRGSI